MDVGASQAQYVPGLTAALTGQDQGMQGKAGLAAGVKAWQWQKRC